MENLNKDTVVFPSEKHDYHGHPNYARVFFTLLALFSFSVLMGALHLPTIALIIIFGTAVWKTVLVMRNFMHLKYEPFLILIAVVAVLFCLLAFFWGVYPDVPMVKLDIAK
ncbi:MAG: cytochrome C oxidase subunit IV family protein [Bacteroidota bacterium]